MASLFDGWNDVDMSRGPADGQAPSGVRWDPGTDAPSGGKTPAARHASATGAAAAAPKVGGRVRALLGWFLSKDRLTLDEARVLLGVPVNCVTGPWSRLEALGWIEGTGEYFTYTNAHKRAIRREYHRLTVDGRRVAEIYRQKGSR